MTSCLKHAEPDVRNCPASRLLLGADDLHLRSEDTGFGRGTSVPSVSDKEFKLLNGPIS